MAVPDSTVLEVLKDWVWVPALGLISWAWKRNEKEHDDMRATATKIEENLNTLGSHLNDKLMEHIDDQVKDVRLFVIAEDAKLMAEMTTQRGHIGKIFDKMEEQGRRNEDHHIATLKAIGELANTMHTALAGKADK